MQPETASGPGTPDRPLPIAQVNVEMVVVDSDGDDIGTVTAVEMPGTRARPDVAPDEVRTLVDDGYLHVQGGGRLDEGDYYVAGSQIAGVTTTDNGVVTLMVPRAEIRSAVPR
jgi:hypothetical protein